MIRLADRLKKLIEEAKARGIPKSKIARALGISPQHLSNLLGGHTEWRLTHVENLCDFLEISPAEAFFEPGENLELHVLLQKILDAGPQPNQAISWNIRAIADRVMVAGPKLERRPKLAAAKKKANG
jgi:transcriptional regulator with XRE-family HTH domain